MHGKRLSITFDSTFFTGEWNSRKNGFKLCAFGWWLNRIFTSIYFNTVAHCLKFFRIDSILSSRSTRCKWKEKLIILYLCHWILSLTHRPFIFPLSIEKRNAASTANNTEKSYSFMHNSDKEATEEKGRLLLWMP